jgi:hypothetical protein
MQTVARGRYVYLFRNDPRQGVIMDGHHKLGWAGDMNSSPSAGYLKGPAEIDALSQLKQQKVNFGVALAEASSTADTVGDIAGKLGRSIRQARKGNLKKAWHELGLGYRNVPKNVLQYKYGISPLMSDIKGSCELLQERLKPADWLVTVKGVKVEKVQHTGENIPSDGTGPSWTWVINDEMGCFVRLDYHPSNQFFSHLSSLGLSNPLELMWETIPFSFVYDWIHPVGEWLGTMDAALGYTFKSGSWSEISRRRVVCTASSRMGGGSRCLENSMSPYKGRFVGTYRGVYSASPIPRIPSYRNPVSASNLAAGLSLLAEAVGRKR